MSSERNSQPPLRVGLWSALAFHAILAAVAIAIPVGYYWRNSPERGAAAAAGSSRGDEPPSVAAPSGPEPVEQSPKTPAVDRHSLAAAMEEKIAENLENSLAEAAKKTPEENLQRLAEMTKTLEETVAPESIDELAGKFRDWFGVQERASAPAAPEPLPAGVSVSGSNGGGETSKGAAFDFDTAQLHSVLRKENGAGAYVYRSVLVDAQGKTMEVELDPASGETAFKTMEMLRSSPLAEKLYRQIAMPMLDKMIAAGKGAAAAAAAAEKAAEKGAASGAGKLPAESPAKSE